MLSNEECQGTETIGGLEVCVLGEAKTFLKGAFQLATRHAEQAVKARGMAQQVAFGERDDAFAGTPPLTVARTPLALTSSENLERNRYIRLFDVWHPPRTAAQPDGNHREQVYRDVVTVQQRYRLGPGSLDERAVRNEQSFETLDTVTLESRRWSTSRVFPRTLYHASHVTTIELGGNQKRTLSQNTRQAEVDTERFACLSQVCTSPVCRVDRHTEVVVAQS